MQDDKTALHCAAAKGDVAVLSILIAHGADIGATDRVSICTQFFRNIRSRAALVTQMGRSILHHAAINGQAAIIEEALGLGVNVNVMDKVSDAAQLFLGHLRDTRYALLHSYVISIAIDIPRQ